MSTLEFVVILVVLAIVAVAWRDWGRCHQCGYRPDASGKVADICQRCGRTKRP